MNQGLSQGCSFLEDYTLNFDGANSAILQSHMLEVCPLIAASKPRLEVHFLGDVYKRQVLVIVLLLHPKSYTLLLISTFIS